MASYLGTRAEHEWVELLLECHGPAWESHDRVGKSCDSELLHFRQEVPACRSLFLKELENEREIGFSKDEAISFRWHGVSGRAVRCGDRCPARTYVRRSFWS